MEYLKLLFISSIRPSNTIRGGNAKIIKERIKHYEGLSKAAEQTQVTFIIIPCKTQAIQMLYIAHKIQISKKKIITIYSISLYTDLF